MGNIRKKQIVYHMFFNEKVGRFEANERILASLDGKFATMYDLDQKREYVDSLDYVHDDECAAASATYRYNKNLYQLAKENKPLGRLIVRKTENE